MYRTPEIVDLYSNFPIGEKQDIWVRQLACVPGQPDWPPGPWVRLRPPGPRPPFLFLGSSFPLVVLSPLLRPLSHC